MGCGATPKAATGADVCPVQLKTRPKHKRTLLAGQTDAKPRLTAPKPRVSRPQTPPTLKGIAANLASRDEAAAPLSRAPLPQQTEPALPEPVPAPAEPTVPPVESVSQTPPLELSPAPAIEARPQPSLVPPEMQDELIQVNFEEVDIRTVLKTIGEITGINFIPHKSVSGPVTVMSPTPIRLGEIYPFLQSILDVHGYAAIEADNAVKIVPKTDAIKSNVQVRVGADPLSIPKNDAMVTQILPLEFADAAEVSQIVKTLLSTGAQMTTHPRTNSIMVTDTSANIHHIARIVEQLDVAGSKEKVVMFPLEHASAQVLSEQITRILNESQAVAPQPGRARAALPPGKGPRILPDERTNSIIVVAGEQEVETIRGLISQLDIERPTGMDSIHVTYLKNADANDVAPSLEAALASMRLTGTVDASQQIQVTADDSTNSLIIVASPQDFEMISQIIEKLDIVREQVLVEMMILEVTEESLTQIGIDWATLDEAVVDSVRGFGLTNLGPRVDFLSGDLEGLAVGAWKETSDGVTIGAILQALKRESAVNILSTPLVLTSNHRTAKVVVGENRPFVVQSRVTETTDFITPTVIKSFEYKDVGITLEVTPHISQSGLIRLEIDSEFTKLLEDITTGSSETPTTAKRNAQTTVTMAGGDTAVIGGLIRDDTSRVQDKIPLLGDLPILGGLFRSQKDVLQKTNLLIFITPHVMTDQEQLQEVTRQKREQMAPLLRDDR
jgi:general secretion pathway protein D